LWTIIKFIEAKYPLIENRYFIKNHKALYARYRKAVKTLDSLQVPANVDKWAVIKEGKKLASLMK
jgi:hypothetical protein